MREKKNSKKTREEVKNQPNSNWLTKEVFHGMLDDMYETISKGLTQVDKSNTLMDKVAGFRVVAIDAEGNELFGVDAIRRDTCSDIQGISMAEIASFFCDVIKKDDRCRRIDDLRKEGLFDLNSNYTTSIEKGIATYLIISSNSIHEKARFLSASKGYIFMVPPGDTTRKLMDTLYTLIGIQLFIDFEDEMDAFIDRILAAVDKIVENAEKADADNVEGDNVTLEQIDIIEQDEVYTTIYETIMIHFMGYYREVELFENEIEYVTSKIAMNAIVILAKVLIEVDRDPKNLVSFSHNAILVTIASMTLNSGINESDE